MTLAIGIEIGGTKLQVGVGLKNEKLIGLVRTKVDPQKGADGIREILLSLTVQALQKANRSIDDIAAIGVGFGGPVDSKNGITLLSHQIEGWKNFPLKEWLEKQWNLPVAIQNDASIAGYAEAVLGAGRNQRRIFYITIGSGIGGGFVQDGVIDDGQGLGAAEIGHTWVPNPETGKIDKLELICSGWSMANRAQDAVASGEPSIMAQMCAGDIKKITAETIYSAAEQYDILARAILEETCNTLSVSIGNVINLLHPERIIIGGGVSLMGPLFWVSLKEKVKKYVMKPFANEYEIVPAVLREEVVVAGAALLGTQIAERQ